jgi:tetratricopeptide (TPR) repeat protein
MLIFRKLLKNTNFTIFNLLLVSLLIPLSALAEDSVSAELATFMDRISEINLNYEVEGQEPHHEALLKEVEAYFDQHQDQAEAWVLIALAKASYARSQGIGALGLMKEVRRELEQAMEIDTKVMGGYAYSFLGRLYFTLPAWPISYGSNKKAKRYIEESLSINDQSMENHFSYGNFLSQQKQYDLARQHFEKAKTLSPVINEANWVANMRKQIDEFLVYLEGKTK